MKKQPNTSLPATAPATHLLKDDHSLKETFHSVRGLIDNCNAYVQIQDHSMSPSYEPDGYLFCRSICLEELKPGKAYVFLCKINGERDHIFRVFWRIVNRSIQIGAANNDFNPCEPLPVANLLEVFEPMWLCTMEKHDE